MSVPKWAKLRCIQLGRGDNEPAVTPELVHKCLSSSSTHRAFAIQSILSLVAAYVSNVIMSGRINAVTPLLTLIFLNPALFVVARFPSKIPRVA